MILLLLVAFVLTSATVIIHAFGTLLAIEHLSRVWRRKKEKQGSFVSVIQILRVVSVGIVRRPDPVPCPNCAVGEWDMCRNGQYTERGIKERGLGC
jgi:hypothetical protein